MAGKTKNSRKEKETTVSTLTRLTLAKAMALQQQGLLQEAKILCEDVLKEHPDNFDCLHLLGLIALQGGDYYQAAKLIGKAVDIYPHNPAFFYHLGVALQELGELDGAMTGYDLATALNPDFTEAWYNWGNALQKCERFDEAVACYDKALAGRWDFAEAHYNRAVALKELKKYEEALLAYDQAIALKPDYGEAYFGRGNALAELKRSLDALTDYDHALSLRPDYAEAYLGRGIVLQELKMLDEALASYDRALALKPDYAEVYQNHAIAIKERRKREEPRTDDGYQTIASKSGTAAQKFNLRPAAFILASTDHGSMLINRFDYRLTGNGGYGVGFQLLNTSSFDHDEVDLLLQLLNLRRQHFGDGVVAIDCGANIGVHTVEWAKFMHGWGKVIAIEAQERIFYALAGNITLNNCFNARAIWAAAGREEGSINVPVPNYFVPSSFGSMEIRQTESTEFIGQVIDYSRENTQATRMVSIDGMALPRVDLIKIDIEGMEMEAIEGASHTIQKLKPQLVIEKIKANESELNSFLSSRGYKTFPSGINLLAVHESDPITSMLKR